MAGKPTEPRIGEEQNTPTCRRLVAAQARLYSDAKTIFAIRIFAVLLLSLSTSLVALFFPGLRIAVGVGGGVLIFILSIIVGSVEKWVRLRAAATQEQFDTHIFKLPWNSLHVDRAPQLIVASAARRYKESRDKDWYTDTGQTHRPFDVLICQASNLSWGVKMHLLWAWTLVGTTLVAVVLLGVGWLALSLPATESFAALVIPFLGPIKEISEQIKSNFEAARTKESAERKLADLWDSGMKGIHIPTTHELRSIQDKIVVIRQTNPYVPDWFDRLFHKSNEAAMRATVSDRVTQASRYGHSD